MSILSLCQDFVHEITKENDFEKSISGLFVPEGMWRISSAMGISWIDVL
jgi:hypothetical protein